MHSTVLFLFWCFQECTWHLHPMNHHIHTAIFIPPMSLSKDMKAKKSPRSSSPWWSWADSRGKPHVWSLDHLGHLSLSLTMGIGDLIRALGQGHLPPGHPLNIKRHFRIPIRITRKPSSPLYIHTAPGHGKIKRTACCHVALPAIGHVKDKMMASYQIAATGWADVKEPRKTWSGKAHQLISLLETPIPFDSLTLFQEIYSTEILHVYESICKNILNTTTFSLAKKKKEREITILMSSNRKLDIIWNIIKE